MYALTPKEYTVLFNLMLAGYCLNKSMVRNYFNWNTPFNLFNAFMKISILFIQTDPLPPGPIETNASFFHPQKLFLRWPKDNFNVNWYYIKINEHWEKVYSTEYYWPKHLNPGTNYTIQIVVYCWWYSRFTKSSTYNGYIQTQRKYNTFSIQPTKFSL